MLNALNRPLKLYLDTSVPNFLFVDDADDKLGCRGQLEFQAFSESATHQVGKSYKRANGV